MKTKLGFLVDLVIILNVLRALTIIFENCRLKTKASCPMDLRNFPYDSQLCYLEIESCELNFYVMQLLKRCSIILLNGIHFHCFSCMDHEWHRLQMEGGVAISPNKHGCINTNLVCHRKQSEKYRSKVGKWWVFKQGNPVFPTEPASTAILYFCFCEIVSTALLCL